MDFRNYALTYIFTFFTLLTFAQEMPIPDRGIKLKSTSQSVDIDSKKYALVIGTDEYKGKPVWGDLKNAEYDAESIKEILNVKYGFTTQLLLSPTKNDVFKALISYHKKLKSNDRFLLFIAGHGDYDKTIYDDGFLVFQDSKIPSEDLTRSTYLGYQQLNNILNALPSKHVGIILDVCFGGTFNSKVGSYRSGNTQVYQGKSSQDFARQKLAKKSRLFLTSGALEPVPDGYAEKHSPFCYLLLDALEHGDNKGHPITLSWLHQQAQLNITESLYGYFGDNQPGSEFIIGGIKSEDNSSLVNKILEEKNLKQKAEKKERESRSLVLVQKAREAYFHKNYSKVVQYLDDAYQLDSSNTVVQDIYYKMMLENDSLYFEQVLSKLPLKKERLVSESSAVINDLPIRLFDVDYDNQKIVLISNQQIQIIDFDGNLLTSRTDTQAEKILQVTFQNNQIYIHKGSSFIVLDGNLDEKYSIPLKQKSSLNLPSHLNFKVAKDNEYVLLPSSLNHHTLYKGKKLVTEIQIGDITALRSIDFTNKNHITFEYYKDDLSTYPSDPPIYFKSYNLKGQQTTNEYNTLQNYRLSHQTIYNNFGQEVFEVKNSDKEAHIIINSDTLCDIFYTNSSNELVREHLKNDTTGVEKVESNSKGIIITTENKYPKDYIVLEDSIVVIAHENDITLTNLYSNKIIKRFRCTDYVKMLAGKDEKSFFLLTKGFLQQISSQGEVLHQIKTPLNESLYLFASPNDKHLIIAYENYYFSVINNDFIYEAYLFQSDPILNGSHIVREVKFLTEDTYLIYGDIGIESSEMLNRSPRIFNHKGQIVKRLKGEVFITTEYINAIESIKSNHCIIAAFDSEKQSPLLYEINKKGDITHQFAMPEYTDQMEHYIYKLDETSFVYSDQNTTKIYHWSGEHWIDITNIQLINSDSLLTTKNIETSFQLDAWNSNSHFIYLLNKDGQSKGPYIKKIFLKDSQTIQFLSLDGTPSTAFLNTISDSIFYGSNKDEFAMNVVQRDSIEEKFSRVSEVPIQKSNVIQNNLEYIPILLSDEVKAYNRKKTNVYTPIEHYIHINDSLIILFNSSKPQLQKSTVEIYNINTAQKIYTFKDQYHPDEFKFNYDVANNILFLTSWRSGKKSIFINLTNYNKLEVNYSASNIIFDHELIAHKTDQDFIQVNTINSLEEVALIQPEKEVYYYSKGRTKQYSPSLQDLIYDGKRYLLKTNHYLYELDIENQKLLPIEQETSLTKLNKFKLKVRGNTVELVKEYYRRNSQNSSFGYQWIFKDSVLKEITLPLNNQEDVLKVVYKSDNLIVLQNKKSSFFFDYSKEQKLSYINENVAFTTLNYNSQHELFTGVVDNNIYVIDKNGVQQSHLKLNHNVESAAIVDHQLRIFIYSDNTVEGEINVGENKSGYYQVPLFQKGLLKLREEVLFK
ncbi:caspase family protein [Flammeovirga agarivorans]|uniref:Caspase family protein n=1 Tax=Flammeovirga agarivorans TaxID=2726742 RepID=A0A7X8SPT8_9BACT|nr:caspase family protein [Flammeovirga agarivorans]NLR94090.1 caspase family protein [Flammeovirga agarivorans]